MLQIKYMFFDFDVLKERNFTEKLNDNHEQSMKRLGDSHREKIALLERQSLQQKQQLLRGLFLSPYNLFDSSVRQINNSSCKVHDGPWKS